MFERKRFGQNDHAAVWIDNARMGVESAARALGIPFQANGHARIHASAAALVGVTTAFYDYFRDFCLQLHLFLETSSQQGHARVGVRIGQWYKLAADCN